MRSFRQHIINNLSFLVDKKILVAVSGGVDSVVLLDMLCQSGTTSSIGIAHFNFQLRESESEEDALFVAQLAKKYEVDFYIKKENTNSYAEQNKLSIQLAARKLRYDWFEELVAELEYDYLLTAHHLDDQVETFLINFSRGTGIEGLLGIPQRNEYIVRPMLYLSKKDILTYAAENNLSWREDRSNASDKYYRNKIRHHILPVLKELNPSFLKSFQQTIQHLSQNKDLTDDAVRFFRKKVCKEESYFLSFNLYKMKEFKNWKSYLINILRPLGFTSFSDIFQLTEAENGKKIYAEHYVIEKNPFELLLKNRKDSIKSEEFVIFSDSNTENLPIKINFHRINVEDMHCVEKNCIFADSDYIVYPLKLRKPKRTDVFYPFGMKGNKKEVFKYFRDEKYSSVEKDKIWILEDAKKHIIWIVGHRADERFRITEKTNNILKITVDL